MADFDETIPLIQEPTVQTLPRPRAKGRDGTGASDAVLTDEPFLLQADFSDPLVSAELEQALSAERFSRYLGWADGDRARAFELYAQNAHQSAALYLPLQMLEVVLRNRIHTVLSNAVGPDWFDNEDLLTQRRQQAQIARAKAEITEQRRAPTGDRIVSALMFSFWTNMLSPAYENLWQTTLHRIARRADGKGLRRRDLADPLMPIRSLRNRIAHHEPVVHWNLPRYYRSVLTIVAWLSPVAAVWCRDRCGFDV